MSSLTVRPNSLHMCVVGGGGGQEERNISQSRMFFSHALLHHLKPYLWVNQANNHILLRLRR